MYLNDSYYYLGIECDKNNLNKTIASQIIIPNRKKNPNIDIENSLL